MLGRCVKKTGSEPSSPCSPTTVRSASHIRVPSHIGAVVACGPRPDSAGIALKMVSVPALLIAHSPFDDIDSHRRALGQLEAPHDLIVLHDPGDPIAAAVDIAQTIRGFLTLFGSSARNAA